MLTGSIVCCATVIGCHTWMWRAEVWVQRTKEIITSRKLMAVAVGESLAMEILRVWEEGTYQEAYVVLPSAIGVLSAQKA